MRDDLHCQIQSSDRFGTSHGQKLQIKPPPAQSLHYVMIAEHVLDSISSIKATVEITNDVL